MSTPQQSSSLSALLSKLRPFQRTAFEFAVHGTLPSETDHDDKNSTNRSTKSPHAKRWDGKQKGGTKKVAGAGTGRLLLGDEMGLGKTLTSLAIMLAYQTEWPLLILCPASLRYTWPTEIEKWCPWIPSQSIHVVRGADDVHFARQIERWRNQRHQASRCSEEDNMAGAKKQPKKCPIQIVIVTYSLLQNRFQIANVLRDCEFECIIADESHNLKQLSSQRCQLALPLLQGSNRLVLLSGTPALNRPVELWPQLHALDAKGRMFDNGNGISYNQYTKRYCNARRTRFGYDVKGVSNADELHECLRSVMMRRLKNDVLHDLPSKQRTIVPISILDKDKERESRETMSQLSTARKAVMEITDLDADDVANSAQWEARRLLMEAYQASGVAKAPATTEYILDWLEGSDATQKLVVFAHHKEVLNYIEEAISKKYKGRLGMMRIDGSVPPAERAQCVKKFQSNKTIRVALLSMTAAGVGLTLTAASNIIFAELHWTPGVLAQAEDRCHRIGQANSVNVMYAICKDEEVSVDMTLWKMIAHKVGNLGRVVDGERGKGLNAVEEKVDASSKGGTKNNNVSVEEELSSFFASSNVSSSKKQKNGPVIVAGTIQSFFTKKQAKKSEPAAKKPTLVNKEKTPKSKATAACISLVDEDECDSDIKMVRKSEIAGMKSFLSNRGKASKTKPKAACISLLDEEECTVGSKVTVIEGKSREHPEAVSESTAFTCHICTFENQAGVAACTMCDTPRASESQHLVNKEAESKSSPPAGEWSCSICTYINHDDVSCCVMCNTERHQCTQNVKNVVDTIYDQQSTPSTSKECEFEDDEWDEADLAAIDILNQSHTQVSQSVSQSPSSTTSPPANAQKDCMSRECTLKPKSSQTGTSDILSFSVSRNSGRIALHASSSGQPLHVNFDISQVLSKESADRLENTNLSRKAPNSTFSQPEQELSFDDRAIEQVLAAIDYSVISPKTLSSRKTSRSMCMELKQFVRCYLSLREVEKKAVKESGEAIAPSSLRQTVAKLLVSTVTGTTERYLGGAKERAIANMKNNCATSVDKAVINGQACAWCAKPFLCSSGATYCSQSCVEEGRVRRGGWNSSTKIREQLFALEKGVCTKCNIDAHALFCKMKALSAPAERLNALLNAKWKLPQTRQATDRLLSDPKESDFWQADHELAVAEGGGSTGLDNLRTLCTPCHAGETEKLFARLKTMPGTQSDESARDGLTQMDITSCFSKMKSDNGISTKKRKRRRVAD